MRAFVVKIDNDCRMTGTKRVHQFSQAHSKWVVFVEFGDGS
jgi:hypothetical protein